MVAADIGAGLADALTAPLDHKDKGLQSLTLDQSVRKNEKLKLAAQGAEKTYGNGDSLNTGKLKNDKVSRFDFIRQIEVDGQLITLESGEFQVYKQSHSALTAFQTEQIQDSEHSGKMVAKRQFRIGDLGGEHTAFNQLPDGKAEYRGTAFGSDDAGGKLTYTIDFTKKQGNGKIEHLKSPELNVELASAEIKADGKSHAVILGDVRYGSEEKGSYSLGIFGGRAQEVAGSAEVKTVNGIRHIGLAAKQLEHHHHHH
uniref:FACTOR H BINDING PROTEIN n=1 Tax=Neisseria meningitidis serogroup B (strain ATCC BAA-335 / MC58) TaxID=122586 RepID=UPI000219FD33|nr:Chain A, FACTOR H BINDING PROTEIN [Neisseria meningitidis MC58]2Y7S_B Chain B, FACTOR H BINDING PROTEIN [Neisseria meningitidis MC58]